MTDCSSRGSPRAPGPALVRATRGSAAVTRSRGHLRQYLETFLVVTTGEEGATGVESGRG